MGKRHALKFRWLPGSYSIVRLAPNAPVPDWATKSGFTSITRTAHELSIVCPMKNIPKDVDPGPRWVCYQLEGPFAFSQTGILLSPQKLTYVWACTSCNPSFAAFF